MPLDTISGSARAELTAVNKLLSEATAIRDEKQQTVDRLSRPTAQLDEAKADHAVEKAAYDAQLVTWYGNGCAGARPEVPSSLLSAEQGIGEAQRDLDAIGGSLEAAKAARDAANERVAEISNRRTAVFYRAAKDAAENWVMRYAGPALLEGLMKLSIVQALAEELGGRGEQGVSYQLRELIRIALGSIDVEGDREAARCFLAELEKNPEAEIIDLGSPAIKSREVPILRPAEETTPPPRATPVQEVQPEYRIGEPFLQNPTRAAVMRQEAGLSDAAEGEEATPEPPESPVGTFTLGPPPPEVPAWVQSSGPLWMPSPRRSDEQLV
jgi:hypothetical protein